MLVFITCYQSERKFHLKPDSMRADADPSSWHWNAWIELGAWICIDAFLSVCVRVCVGRCLAIG
jgi:hypothetical protein